MLKASIRGERVGGEGIQRYWTRTYIQYSVGSKHTERGWGERVCKVTRLLDVEDTVETHNGG